MLQRMTLSVCIAAAAAAAVAQTPPAAGIEGGEIRAAVASKGETVTRRVVFFAPSPDPTKPAPDVVPVISDRTADTVQVVFDGIELLSNVGRYEWTARARITGLPQAGYDKERTGHAVVGNAKYGFRYTLTTRPKLTSWTATASVPKLLWTKHELPIVVTANGGAGGKLSVLRSTLTDASTDNSIAPHRLDVCDAPAGACKPPVLPPDVPTRAYLRIERDVPPGNYTGGVDLQIENSLQPQTLAVTLSRSNPRAIGTGVVLLILGVLASAFVGIVARHLAARTAAMLPAARLAQLKDEKVATLDRLIGSKQGMPILREELDKIGRALSREEVDRFVGGWIPSPFGSNASAATAFATYLQAKSDRLSVLTYIIEHGVRGAVHAAAQRPDAKPALETALRDLDELALDSQATAEQLKPEIEKILATLQEAVRTKEGVESHVAAPLPSTRQLLVTLDVVNLGVWIIWAVVTIVLGYAALVLINRGFGTPMDLVKCFFWGLGVQTAGDQLQQARASSATTALNITIPT